jgi:hypothetical protein
MFRSVLLVLTSISFTTMAGCSDQQNGITARDIITPLLILFGGGAAGAIITLIATYYRNRIQVVSYDLVRILPTKIGYTGQTPLQVVIRMPNLNPDGTAKGSINLDRPSIVNLQIVNTTNKDFETFKFGITFDVQDNCFHVECDGPDRHHEIKCDAQPTPDVPLHKIDFILKPFNRGERYIVRLIIESGGFVDYERLPIKIGTPEVGLKMVQITKYPIVRTALDIWFFTCIDLLRR